MNIRMIRDVGARSHARNTCTKLREMHQGRHIERRGEGKSKRDTHYTRRHRELPSARMREKRKAEERKARTNVAITVIFLAQPSSRDRYRRSTGSTSCKCSAKSLCKCRTPTETILISWKSTSATLVSFLGKHTILLVSNSGENPPFAGIILGNRAFTFAVMAPNCLDAIPYIPGANLLVI